MDLVYKLLRSEFLLPLQDQYHNSFLTDCFQNSKELVRDRVLLALGVQGLAAEVWEKEHGDRGLLASEIASLVPGVLRELSEGAHS